MAEQENKTQSNFKHIIRVQNTDLDGNKQIFMALQKIKGVKFSFANALLQIANIDRRKKAGNLDDNEVAKLQEIIKEPLKYGVPLWMINRRNDYETGEDIHLLTTDVKYVKENDIKRLQKIKSYRGLRLAWGLPVRGQRTKSNFRKNKGKAVGKKKVKLK